MQKLSILLTLFFLWTNLSIAVEPDPVAAKTVTTLLQGVEDNKLETYLSVCDEDMKKAINADALDELNILLGEAMAMGYKAEYLGKLDKGDLVMHLWKLNFKVAGIPDMLVELLLNGDKANAFSIK